MEPGSAFKPDDAHAYTAGAHLLKPSPLCDNSASRASVLLLHPHSHTHTHGDMLPALRKALSSEARAVALAPRGSVGTAAGQMHRRAWRARDSPHDRRYPSRSMPRDAAELKRDGAIGWLP
eukprot:scaffold21762_cov113-Isochrysis_galbana.AAC.2